jgi:hypothetical protein
VALRRGSFSTKTSSSLTHLVFTEPLALASLAAVATVGLEMQGLKNQQVRKWGLYGCHSARACANTTDTTLFGFVQLFLSLFPS